MAHYGKPPARPRTGAGKRGPLAKAKIATRKAASAASGGIGPRVAARLGGRTPVKPKPRTGLATPKPRGPRPTRTTQRPRTR